MMQRYKEILKEIGIKDADVGRMFNYKNDTAWRNSARRDKVIAGVVAFYESIKSKPTKGKK